MTADMLSSRLSAERHEVGGLDEPEPAARAGVACEERRRRQEQLVHLARLQERAERVRAGLAEDPAMPSLAEGVDDHVAREPQLPAEGDDDRSVGESVLEPCHATVARQHERPAAEHGMVGVDMAPARTGPRSRAPGAGRGSRGARRTRPRQADRSSPRAMCSRRCAKDARTDEHDVGQRAQKPHEEPVGVVVARDHGVRVGQRRNRDDAVERRDEVRVDALLREPQVSAVDPRELRRQRDDGKAGVSSARTSNGSTPRS